MFFFFFQKFSERLKELRLSKGLTMEQLGKEIETTRGTIGNFENGNKKPEIDSSSYLEYPTDNRE